MVAVLVAVAFAIGSSAARTPATTGYSTALGKGQVDILSLRAGECFKERSRAGLSQQHRPGGQRSLLQAA